jgi:mannose-1-phosphate guanylyltransferase
LYAVIMAGGGGTRFWPLSRAARPKQFLSIGDGAPMVTQTVDRIIPLIPPENILIVTRATYVEKTRELVTSIPPENVLSEPSAKNTAPCIALALAEMQKRNTDDVMVVLPADHLIGLPDRFLKALAYAAEIAADGQRLITLGIRPNRPETGYGYLKLGTKIVECGEFDLVNLDKFVEKPDLSTAWEYYHSKQYLWNAGMFIWHTDALRRELKAHLPGLASAINPMAEALETDDRKKLTEIYNSFTKNVEATSIDYGLMEKSSKVVTVPVDIDWSDVGSFPSLRDIMPPQEGKNVGKFRHMIQIESNNNIVHSPDKLVALVGVNDIIVIETPDALLICHADEAQKIRKVVARMKEEDLDEYL